MAFERIPSGYPGVDEVFDYIRMGDNVVWQVSDLEEYRLFAEAFARQALEDGRNLIYMHYARHESLFSPKPGLKVFEFDPMQGFEPFTVEIYNRITEEGKDAFYIFDCLSELQVAWHTDQMMGNFFRVTCPYLYELNPVAYFPLIRGRHSFETMASIRDTTQVLIDVYTSDSAVYIHTLKAMDRNSVNIYLPHVYTQESETACKAVQMALDEVKQQRVRFRSASAAKMQEQRDKLDGKAPAQEEDDQEG